MPILFAAAVIMLKTFTHVYKMINWNLSEFTWSFLAKFLSLPPAANILNSKPSLPMLINIIKKRA